MSSAQLRINSVEGDGWTWSYVEPDSDIELHSNETYGSREAAVEWARRAYPDLEVENPEE